MRQAYVGLRSVWPAGSFGTPGLGCALGRYAAVGSGSEPDGYFQAHCKPSVQRATGGMDEDCGLSQGMSRRSVLEPVWMRSGVARVCVAERSSRLIADHYRHPCPRWETGRDRRG